MTINFLETNITKKNFYIIFLVILLSIFLNQQTPILGLNISLSDFIALIMVLILFSYRQFLIPQKTFVFFTALTIITFLTSFYISPIRFNFYASPIDVLSNYIKLLSSFLYFLLGYIIFNLNLVRTSLKWYSFTALLIGALGIIFTLLSFDELLPLFYYENVRFSGLLQDPNYFGVIQCTALVYFLRTDNIKKITRFLSTAIIFFSIVVSGSKTGMILFVFFVSFWLITSIFKKKNKNTLLNFAIYAFFLTLTPLLFSTLLTFLETVADRIPVFNRVLVLFNNFSTAFSNSGSLRDTTWTNAFKIISEVPIFGTGVGSYLPVANSILGKTGLAHNTYLQLFAEWGIIFAAILFGYIFVVLLKHFTHSKVLTNEAIIIRDMILILLVGSLSLSLNNARMFWFFIGILSASYGALHIRRK